jgi:hypothetical protein
MDQEVETPNDEELDPTAVEQGGESSQGEADPIDPVDHEGEEPQAAGEAPGDDDGLAISIGDDEPDPEPDIEKAPQWVREMRKEQPKLRREIRDLRAENERLKATSAPPAIVVGEKPTMESCGYDEAKFETELEAYHKRKNDAEAQVRERERAQAEERRSWDTRVAAYQEAKSKLKAKVSDFDDAEAAVLASFDVTQQGILILAKQSEMLTYALGKNDKVREGLAKIKNYGEFAIAVGELMGKLKVTPRKAPPPERRLSGAAPGSRGTGGADKELARLEAEADRTGDRTKVAQYRRKMAAATA